MYVAGTFLINYRLHYDILKKEMKMNKFYLTVAIIGLVAIGSAHANDYLDAGAKSEVPEYDTIDKAKLHSNIGIEAGLSTGDEISQDSMQRYGTDFEQGQPLMAAPTAPVAAAPTVSAPVTAPTVQTSVSPMMDDNAPVIVYEQPAVAVQQPAVEQNMQPAGGVAVDAVVAPQTVTVEQVAVGNTDTGVDMNQVQELLQKQ